MENLSFKIGLSAQFWAKRPEYSVAVDGQEFAHRLISGNSGEVEYIEFTVNNLADGPHTLEIGLLNKEPSDTVESPDKTSILSDMILTIENIEIDDIDLSTLIYTHSYYQPVKKQIYNGEVVDQLTQCVNLGWNGTYFLPFSSPFYLWLLSTL